MLKSGSAVVAAKEGFATRSPFVVRSYRPLNLPGEYDFSGQPPPAEAPFNKSLIAAWQPLS